MISMNVAPLEPTSALGPFLKMLRQRISPGSGTLGPADRLPIRRGRRVTQEEIAEAVGVSRNWYRRLESGADVHASTKLLARLAHVLLLTPDERITLFALAVPEMWPAEIAVASYAMVAAFSRPQPSYGQASTSLEAV
jgi:transcriptional regulator with XRE-family HTH domain